VLFRSERIEGTHSGGRTPRTVEPLSALSFDLVSMDISSNENSAEVQPVSPRLIKPNVKRDKKTPKSLQRRALILDQYGFQQPFSPTSPTPPLNLLPKKLTNYSQNIKLAMAVQWQEYMDSIGNDINRIKRCKTLKNLIKMKGIPPQLRGDRSNFGTNNQSIVLAAYL